MKDLTEQILATARARNLKQIPRWRFALARSILAILLFVAILVGAIAFGLLLESLWPDVGVIQGRGFKQMAIGVLPLLLLSFFILLSGLGAYAFRHFHYGYRIRVPLILTVVLGLSLMGGIATYRMNLTFLMHRGLMQNVPTYRMAFEGQRRTFWVNPQAGRLAGELLSVNQDTIRIRDFSGKEWTVLNTASTETPSARSGSYRFVGAICGVQFCAEAMRPWDFHGHQGKGGGNGKGMHRQMLGK